MCGALILSALAGCALFSTGEEPAEKSTVFHYEDPAMPFHKIDESTADGVWQSEKTGNTIAVNSSCRKEDDSLKSEENSILAGIEHLKSRTSKKIKFDGETADRIHAEGETDGDLVDVELVIVRKDDCTYDLAYVARHVSFNEELGIFEKFLERFHAP